MNHFAMNADSLFPGLGIEIRGSVEPRVCCGAAFPFFKSVALEGGKFPDLNTPGEIKEQERRKAYFPKVLNEGSLNLKTRKSWLQSYVTENSELQY